ncbi:hypothetical protein PMAYCL1PPCAC_05964, partial [Pristionchus mayeri]
FACSFTVIFIVLLARHTFSLFKEVKHISVKTQKLFRTLTRSLVVQALVPVITVVLPTAIVMIINVLHFASPQYTVHSKPIFVMGANLWDLLSLSCSMHSVAHMSALIITTPTFRSKLYETIIWWKNGVSMSRTNLNRNSASVETTSQFRK